MMSFKRGSCSEAKTASSSFSSRRVKLQIIVQVSARTGERGEKSETQCTSTFQLVIGKPNIQRNEWNGISYILIFLAQDGIRG